MHTQTDIRTHTATHTHTLTHSHTHAWCYLGKSDCCMTALLPPLPMLPSTTPYIWPCSHRYYHDKYHHHHHHRLSVLIVLELEDLLIVIESHHNNNNNRNDNKMTIGIMKSSKISLLYYIIQSSTCIFCLLACSLCLRSYSSARSSAGISNLNAFSVKFHLLGLYWYIQQYTMKCNTAYHNMT